MSLTQRWLARSARALGSAAELVASQRLSVLIFHRVLAQPDPIFPGEMHAARFEQLLAVLAEAFEVLPLSQAVQLQSLAQLPPRALAITFDDGYADNAEIALPLLQKQGLCATFFVATGFLDGGRMFNDSVIETLRRSKLQRIDLSLFGDGVRPLGSAAERCAAIEAVLKHVKYLSLAGREEELAVLHASAGSPVLPTDLMMRSEQVRQLHQAGMEIGGHTVRHPILQVLGDEEAEQEISAGRQRLQDLIQAPVDVFAYPNGKPGQDYGRREVEIVKRLGFKAAVSTSKGVVTPESDRFQLPRFSPWDRSALRFAGRLLQQRTSRAVAAVAA